MACIDCNRPISTADGKPSPRFRCIPCGAKLESGTRLCPKCGTTDADMQFRIDETVWCLFCDWEGHEDDVITIEAAT